MTMGQAVDKAIEQHAAKYPGSAVYHAEVFKSNLRGIAWLVEVQAEHFSQRLVYSIRGRAE